MADATAYNITSAEIGQDAYSQQIVLETMQEFAQLQLYRNTAAMQWEEIARLVLPTSRNTFFYGDYNWPGMKMTDQQVDATGMMALFRFSAIMDSMLTRAIPTGTSWGRTTPT